MDEKKENKWTKFFLRGGLLCLIGLFFFFYVKGFVLYGNQYGKKKSYHRGNVYDVE